MNFTDQTVLVTGASRGIGRAAARKFAGLGARVAVHYNCNRAAAEATLNDLPEAVHGIFQADLSKLDDVARLAEAVPRRLGEIDVLVNNAGIYEEHSPASTDFEDWQAAWRRTLDANLLGPVHLSYLVSRRMIERGKGGRIVHVTSRGAFRGEPTAPAYGASKAALNAFGQSMAKALAPHGVRVCSVAPGWVETDMAKPFLDGPGGDEVRNQSPLGRAATPEEIAAAIAFLAAEGHDALTGCILDANGASYLRT